MSKELIQETTQQMIESDFTEFEKETKQEEKKTTSHNMLLRLLFGALSIGVFVMIVVLCTNLFLSLFVRNVSGTSDFFDPLVIEESKELKDDTVYQNLVRNDISTLMYYLAATSQLVTDGAFDTYKEVDIIEYVNRKEEIPNRALDQLKLVYSVGDLIQWYREGFQYHYTETTENEASEVEEYERVSDYYEVEENDVVEIAQLSERYLPVDGIAIADRTLPEGVTKEDVWGCLESAASDLATNYDRYNSWAESYSRQNDLSLKYVMCDDKGKVIYSNLNISGKVTSEQVEALRECYSFIRYHYGSNEIEKLGLGNESLSEIDAKNLFHKYSYLFKNGGTIYVAIDTDTKARNEVHKRLGVPDENSAYVNVMRCYKLKSTLLAKLLPKAVILGIALIICLIGFILLQPKKEKGQLSVFDRGFTEIVAAIYILFAILVFCGSIEFLDESYNVSNSIGMSGWQSLFRTIVVVTALVLQSLFLLGLGSLVRRVKAKTLYKGSLFYFLLHLIKKLFTWFGRLCKELLDSIRYNPSLLTSVCLPYLGYLLVNFFLIVCFWSSGIGWLFAFVFDMIVGFFLLRKARGREKILEGTEKISNGQLDYQIDMTGLKGKDERTANHINSMRNAIKVAVDQSRKDERLKAELITNVSHDIKTPLTSIINYVDLLKKEEIQNERAKEYIAVLDQKSQRLKQLTIDLVEASKISTGNIQIEYAPLNLLELMKQALGEYEDKLKAKNLDVIFQKPEEIENLIIRADSRHTWRVFDNLLGNICKYAMDNTRVYIEADRQQDMAVITFKNISNRPLNIPVEELFQRFTRGDESRSTEGSGLGLSIAQSLVQAQGGTMSLQLDGDLFKVIVEFPLNR